MYPDGYYPYEEENEYETYCDKCGKGIRDGDIYGTINGTILCESCLEDRLLEEDEEDEEDLIVYGG